MLRSRYLPLYLIHCCNRKQHNSPKKQGLQSFLEPYKNYRKSVQKKRLSEKKKKEEQRREKEEKRRKKKEKKEKLKQVLFSDVATPPHYSCALLTTAIHYTVYIQ